jgi:hypothetical protein
VDWWVHEIASSDLYSADPSVIRSQWSWRDVVQARMVIRAFARARG